MGPQLAVGRRAPRRFRAAARVAPILHGIDVESFPFGERPGGRPPVPRPVLAREGRRPGDRGGPRSRAGGCVLAGKVDAVDAAHFAEVIEPQIDGDQIRLRRRGRRAPEAAAPRRRPGAAVPDRVGRAVRARDDRGDGLRHAGHRPATGERAGGRRRRASPGFVVDDVERHGPGDRPRSTGSTAGRAAAGPRSGSASGGWSTTTSGRSPSVDRERRRRAGGPSARSAERHRPARGGRRRRCMRAAVA